MTCAREWTFASIGEAMAFCAALEAEGIPNWHLNLEMGTLWGGWWGPLAGFHLRWLETEDHDWIRELLRDMQGSPSEPIEEHFADVFRSANKRKAVFALLVFFSLSPMPTWQVTDIFSELHWQGKIVRRAEDCRRAFPDDPDAAWLCFSGGFLQSSMYY